MTDAPGPTPPDPPAARLKKRPDFLRAATGRKSHSALFTVQGLARSSADITEPRVGFTVTKKVGGAVERNRIKRRLRAVVQVSTGLCMKPTHDYVIVARRAVLAAPFPVVAAGLKTAIRKLHVPPTPRRGSGTKSEGPVDDGMSGS